MPALSASVSPRKAVRLIIHTTIFFVSIIAAIILLESHLIQQFLVTHQSWSYVGAFVAGMLYTSMFTSVTATAVLLVLGHNYPFLMITIVAAFGAVLGDTVILKIIKNDVLEDINTLIKPLTKKKPLKIMRQKAIRLPLTLLAFAIIASPLPDDLGLALLGLVRFKTRYFIYASYVLNFLGILAIVYSATKIAL
jgi:hypothetical protein